MTISELTGNSANFDVGPVKYDTKSIRVHIALVRESDGTFSAIALNLPGCGSCGDTEEEAIANVREAVVGVVESYATADDVPWIESDEYEEIPDGAKLKWILVNG